TRTRLSARRGDCRARPGDGRKDSWHRTAAEGPPPERNPTALHLVDQVLVNHFRFHTPQAVGKGRTDDDALGRDREGAVGQLVQPLHPPYLGEGGTGGGPLDHDREEVVRQHPCYFSQLVSPPQVERGGPIHEVVVV